MDPNATLTELLELAARFRECPDAGAHGEYGQHDGCACAGQMERAGELVAALDGWLSKGGFLPAKWARFEFKSTDEADLVITALGNERARLTRAAEQAAAPHIARFQKGVDALNDVIGRIEDGVF